MSFFQFFIPPIEILIIATVIYYFLSVFWNMRAMDVIFGIIACLALYTLSRLLDLQVIHQMMFYFINVAVIALLIIFQPELRFGLSKLSFKGKKYKEMNEFDKFLESISQSVYRMAERRIGALILLENQDSLDEFANKAVILNAKFSPELLETIFISNTPLHDGAVIIRGTTIVSAATILPLADDSFQISKSMGTRHRAGLGISQLADALIIVVSEETGKVSVAREGIMTRGIKIDRFKGVLRSVFNPPLPTASSINVLSRLRQWTN
ncbi:MAG: diadenylate cyclase CdaA [Parachlamydiaceae bacterium]